MGQHQTTIPLSHNVNDESTHNGTFSDDWSAAEVGGSQAYDSMADAELCGKACPITCKDSLDPIEMFAICVVNRQHMPDETVPTSSIAKQGEINEQMIPKTSFMKPLTYPDEDDDMPGHQILLSERDMSSLSKVGSHKTTWHEIHDKNKSSSENNKWFKNSDPATEDNKIIEMKAGAMSHEVDEHTCDHHVSHETRKVSDGFNRHPLGENHFEGINRDPNKDFDSRGTQFGAEAYLNGCAVKTMSSDPGPWGYSFVVTGQSMQSTESHSGLYNDVNSSEHDFLTVFDKSSSEWKCICTECNKEPSCSTYMLMQILELTVCVSKEYNSITLGTLSHEENHIEDETTDCKIGSQKCTCFHDAAYGKSINGSKLTDLVTGKSENSEHSPAVNGESEMSFDESVNSKLSIDAEAHNRFKTMQPLTASVKSLETTLSNTLNNLQRLVEEAHKGSNVTVNGFVKEKSQTSHACDNNSWEALELPWNSKKTGSSDPV